ncbi:MAG: hypothetical protein K8R88_09205 [Armatimonadetes bacterium]|nr:hypothetical protein [Armatimonadota bacterium]
MKKLVTLSLMAASALSFGQFTSGNLVAAVIGDAGSDILNQPVVLQEYTTTGTPVGSALSLNNVGGRNITSDFAETSEAGLELSADGKYLMIAGYDEVPLSGTWNKFDSLRAVARINGQGQITFSSAFTLYDSNFLLGDGARAVASLNGDDFIVTGGDAGLLKGSFGGSTSQVFNPALSTRTAHWFIGLLYFVGSNAYYTAGGTSGTNGLTTWDGVVGNTFAQPGVFQTPLTSGSAPGSGRDFHIVDANTIYMAASSGSVGLVKMVRTNGVWSEAFRLATSGVNSLAVDTSGAVPTIYMTGSNGTNIFKTTDTGLGFSAFQTLATAPVNTRFRGLSFAPQSAAVAGTLTLSNFVGTAPGSNVVPVVIKVLSPSNVVLQTSTVNVTTSGGVGNYSLSLNAGISGSIKLAFSAPTWLVKTVNSTVGATNASAVLANGDSVKDGIIDLSDYTVVVSAFNAIPSAGNWNVTADLNRDDIVDLTDYTVTVSNFNQVDN